MGPHPAVADVRRAVRRALGELSGSDVDRPVLVALSGGADSTALAAATAFVTARTGRPAGAVVIDHRLQDATAAQAARAGNLAYELGLDPVHVLGVDVGTAGGPEAAARDARYTALSAVARAADALVLLAHTRDDQAETVLLGLGRGSGPRSIAGMRARDGRYVRPFLDLPHGTTVAACAALGLPVFHDPHNRDPRFTRVRLRHEALPLLDDVLGGGTSAALARTAALLREDLDALDGLAGELGARLGIERADALAVDPLGGPPRAVRTRVLRAWLHGRGVGPLTAAHLGALDALVAAWRGQGPVDLPGGWAVVRASGRLELHPPARRAV